MCVGGKSYLTIFQRYLLDRFSIHFHGNFQFHGG